MAKTFKDVLAHINRAKAYAKKYEAVRAMQALKEALDMLPKVKGTMSRDRAEICAHGNEVLRTLSGMKELAKVLPPGMKLEKGNEKAVRDHLHKVLAAFEKAKKRIELTTGRNRYEQLDALMIKGQKLLAEGKAVEARSTFRQARSEFGDEPGLLQDIGQKLLTAGLTQEALEYLEAARKADPRDPRSYASLTSAYEALGDLERAAQIVTEAYRNFGPSEKLFVRMAEVAVKRKHWSEAFDAAKQALEINEHSQQAKRIYDTVSPKVLSPQALKTQGSPSR